jgi:hypothetical protein
MSKANVTSPDRIRDRHDVLSKNEGAETPQQAEMIGHRASAKRFELQDNQVPILCMMKLKRITEFFSVNDTARKKGVRRSSQRSTSKVKVG